MTFLDIFEDIFVKPHSKELRQTGPSKMGVSPGKLRVQPQAALWGSDRPVDCSECNTVRNILLTSLFIERDYEL